MAEYKNGLGVAYRALDEEAHELEQLWEKGEVRLSPEEIKWRHEALSELRKLHSRIKDTLEKFSTIAPPPVRTEPE